jgi:hypothetical protein
VALRNQAGAEKTNFTLRHDPPFRSLDKPEPVRLEGSHSLAPVVGSGASNRAKLCRLAPCDYAIDRALPLAEIFTALPAAVLVKT